MANVSLSITIPENKVEKIRKGFLRVRPIPVDPETQVPLYTLKQWVTLVLSEYLQRLALSGLKQIAHDAVNDDVSVTPET
jgi:hypothetical protein